MSTYHDQSAQTLDTTIGINGVAHGGSGADMSATGGSSCVVMQESAGAAFTARPLPFTYLRPSGGDDTAAIQAAVDVSGAHLVLLGVGTFTVSDTITINQDRIHIEGVGIWATVINFVPASGSKPLFAFDKGDGSISYQCSLKNLTIKSTDTSLKKIGVKLVDTSGFALDSVTVGPIGSWTGDTSIGLQIQGRDVGTVHEFNCAADLPISIEDNPNNSIDLDHWHFSDCTLISKSDNTQPIIKVATGVNMTANLFDGRQSWNFGSYGFYWNDTTTAQVSDGLTIKNVRWEQSTSGNYCIYLVSQYGFRRVLLENIQCGNGNDVKGFYFRNIEYVHVADCQYLGTSVAWNADGTVEELKLDNFNYQTTCSVTSTGLTRITGTGKDPANPTPGYVNELWLSSSNGNLASAYVTALPTITANTSSTETFTPTGVVNRLTAAVATTGTTEETMFTHTLKAAALSTNGQKIRVEAWGTSAANGNTKTIKFKFGGTSITFNGTTGAPNGLVWSFSAVVRRINATSQYVLIRGAVGGTAQVTNAVAASETLANDVAVSITFTTPTATGDLTLYDASLEYV